MQRIIGNDLTNLDFTRDMHTHPYEKGRTPEAMEGFVLRAIELGLSGIAFTDHAPIDGRLSAPGHAMPAGEMDRYYELCQELKDKYQNEIDIYIGVEADYHPKNIAFIENLKKKYQFDFFIGSLHLHIPPWADDTADLSFNELAGYAFKQSMDLASSGLFDAMAHFDRFRQVFHKRNFGFNALELREKFTELFNTVKKSGIILELNPHICNTVVGGSMEDFVETVKWAAACGVRFSVGSDAHNANVIGVMFPELKDALKENES